MVNYIKVGGFFNIWIGNPRWPKQQDLACANYAYDNCKFQLPVATVHNIFYALRIQVQKLGSAD